MEFVQQESDQFCIPSKPRLQTHDFQAMLDYYFFNEQEEQDSTSGGSSEESSPRTRGSSEETLSSPREKALKSSKHRSKFKICNRFSSTKNLTEVEKIRRRNRIAQKKSREKKKRILNERNRKMKYLEIENKRLQEENTKLKREIQRLRGDRASPSFTAFVVVFGLILFGKSGIFTAVQPSPLSSSNQKMFFQMQRPNHLYLYDGGRSTGSRGGEGYIF